MPTAPRMAPNTTDRGSEELKEILQLLRTGGLDEVGNRLIALGAPRPAPGAKWDTSIGRRFMRPGIPPNETHDYVRFATIAADAYDQFGLQEVSRQILDNNGLRADVDRDLELARSLKAKELSEADWRLFRQKLYFWLQVSRSAYRDGKLALARQCVERCQNLADTILIPKSAALSADISYRLALIARQQFELDRAIELFGQCMTATFDVLKTDQRVAGARQERLRAARYLVAKCSALGLGYCLIEKGMLREARNAISVGEILLWETKDWRNLQYCELLFSRLLRHEAGRDPKNAKLLDQANSILQGLVDTSGDTVRKPRFTRRVHYELGFVELYSSRFQNAESNFNRVVEAARMAGDGRWHANGLVALARLRLYEGKATNSPDDAARCFTESRCLAVSAGEIAKRAENRWAEARCILMQARAEMELALLPSGPADEHEKLCRSADRNLRAVLEMTDLANPAVRALPLILLARLHSSLGNVPQARQFFDQWTAISNQVQYTALRALGKQVGGELFAPNRGFAINAQNTADEDLNLERQSQALERYMLQRLEARPDLSDEKRAKILGVSRQTYIRHRKELLGQ